MATHLDGYSFSLLDSGQRYAYQSQFFPDYVTGETLAVPGDTIYIYKRLPNSPSSSRTLFATLSWDDYPLWTVETVTLPPQNKWPFLPSRSYQRVIINYSAWDAIDAIIATM
jgi:hypothetical protein